MKQLSNISRIVLAATSLLLLGTLFLPVWQIDLSAPQYPEGLSMQIWLDKITGQVDIINGLNHYIGMKHINASMFPEFSYLTYVVIVFILFGLLVALLGRQVFLVSYIFLLVAGGAAAMIDFYNWGYDYGHNLDPTAAIQVPGLSYQPPLIGHKQLLNFDAYSYPASGGWIIVAVGLIFIAVCIFEFKKGSIRNASSTMQVDSSKRFAAIALLTMIVIGIAGCDTGPEPFAYGKDGCSFCKMTIMAPNFGGEIITRKGKIYKFDDLHCLVSFLKAGEVKKENIAQTLVVNHKKEGEFLIAEKALYVTSEKYHSPMNSNTAAFASAADAAGTATKDWASLYNSIE